jgi:anti-sigma regulatory factor (Ser/Thr protein kinase)
VHADEVELEPAPSSVAAARRFAQAVLEAGGASDDDWTVTQIVSELATNAVVHAGSPFVVSISCDEARIRVSVTDRRPLARATVRRFSNQSTTGRGLRLVQSLGQAWGVDQTDTAKTVWCELRRGAESTHDIDEMEDIDATASHACGARG